MKANDTARPDGVQGSLARDIPRSKAHERKNNARGEASGLLEPSDVLQEAFRQLRESLLEVLPSYMVPSIYVPIAKLPLNASGKMDRKAVRQLLQYLDKDQLAAYVSKETVKLKPSTDTERQLQALWASVLAKPIDSVGANDHFFQSGGDSVTAMKMVAVGRNAQISLTVADVFGNPRLSDLARVLDSRGAYGVEKDSTDDEDIKAFSLWTEGMALDSEDRQRQLTDIAAQCGVQAEQIEDIYPCTPLQEGLMAVTTQQPGAYVAQRLFYMSKTVEVAQFKAIWEKIVAALPILRTRIVPAMHSASLQVVVREPIHWFSASSLQEYLEQDRLMPIQYGGHLCRFTIIEEQDSSTEQSTRYFLWTMHHSIYDGWTTFKIEDMLVRLSKDELTPTPIPISRFVRYLNQRDIEDHRSFWRQQLDGVSKAKFPLPPDSAYQPRARQTVQHHIAVQKQPGHVTTAMVLRGAWALLVAMYTGIDEAVFNVALSGRNAPVQGITDLVGPTVTTVPVRVHIRRSQKVYDFLADIQQQATNMIPFEHTGLQNIRRLVPQLGNDFDPGHLFTVQTVLEQAGESSSIESIGLQRRPVGGEGFHSYAFNISCTTDRESKAIEAQVQFDEAVIAVTQVETLLQQFEHIYHQLSESGTSGKSNHQIIAELSFISAQDTARILEWNKAMPASIQACVHSLVLENTARHPEAPAVCAWDGDMTYDELDRAATRLSHHLVSLGVGPEVMVGLCLDKSKWAIVSMLAILKAGGAVVPLGVQHPVARIQGIINDTAATVMLVDSQQAERVGHLVQHPVIVDDSLLSSLPIQTGVACETITPGNAAWVIYTSGSTGKPKGVVLEHAAICTLLDAHTATANMGQGTRRLQFAAFTFDVSIGDVFGSLLCGGCICVPSENDRANNLGHAMEAMKVNFAHLTSSVVGLINPADVPSMETLLLGGESVTPAIVEQWLGHVVQRNAYGPAECTITACHSHQITDKKQASLIGYPLASHFWVTSEFDYNYLCPVGVTGELLIEGPVLARGYLNDTAKTEAAFVTDPAFVTELGLGKGRRMYRTGDLVRQNEDGSLTFMGRRDTQIKIRGQRVETGEIESSITRMLAGVRAASVDLILHANNSAQAALMAVVEFAPECEHYSQETLASGFLAPSDKLQEDFAQLQESLLEVLPSYMVPSIYVPISTLPLNASGKMDRKALRKRLEAVDKDQLAAYVSKETVKLKPSTDTERQLQALWAVVLAKPIDLVGANDHFFQSGGDSVMAMKMVAAGRNVKISLTVADIFSNPRLSDLASVLDARGVKTHNSDEEDALPFSLWREGMMLNVEDRQRQLADIALQCGVTAEQIEDIYPCTPLQEGLMALTLQYPRSYVSQAVFRLDDTVDMERLILSWRRLTELVPLLRTRIIAIPNSSSMQVVVCEDIEVPIKTSLNEYLSDDQDVVIASGSRLSRVAIVNGTEAHGRDDGSATSHRFFIWTAHHSLYDGWSRRKMLDMLSKLYNHAEEQKPVPMTRFLRHLSQSDTEATMAYWRNQLGGANVTRFPSPPSPTYRPHVTAKVHRRMVGDWRAGSATRAILLRAAWAIVVAAHTGSNETLVAVSLSGRTTPITGILDLLAPTITTVPVHIKIDPFQPLAEFIEQVQKQATDMIPFEHTGLQHIRRLVPELGTSLDTGHLFVVQTGLDLEDSSPIVNLGLHEQEANLDEFHSYPLSISCILDGDGEEVEVVARFDEAVLTHAQTSAILDRFKAIYKQLCSQSKMSVTSERTNGHRQRLADVIVVSNEDVATIQKWNGRDLPPDWTCIHALIQRTTRVRAEEQAVCAWDGNMTYDELDNAATRLSHHLVSLGVGPEVMVGLCMDKSRWAIVSMLAILKAGGAVVPLGVQHPVTRIEGIIHDIAATVMLVDVQQAERVGRLVQHPVIVDDTLLSSLPIRADIACKTVTPDNAAWVVYTSGSTGKPKGVVLEHKGLSTSLQAHSSALGMTHNTRSLQFAAYTFDAAITDIFATLIRGGTVCLPSEDQRMNDLSLQINVMKVNFTMITSTMAGLLDPDQVPLLKTVVLGGEAVDSAVLGKWLGHATIINAYGPSECSIVASCSKAVTHQDEAAVIGSALASRFWVVDQLDYNRLIPIGTVGELLIEGPQLAREYLNDEKKTEAAFVVDPAFVSKLGFGQGRRMYRTGDLVLQNEDGSLTYVGRRDTQIKIRGQRVETGEISYHITEHHSVQQSVVISPKHGPCGSRLICFVALHDYISGTGYGPQIEEIDESKRAAAMRVISQIRDYLAEQVMEYMVPTVWIPLATLPINVSGKTDILQMTRWIENLTMESTSVYTETVTEEQQNSTLPATAQEQQLRAVWSQILSMPESQISFTRSFLALGGDSITAMQVVAQCRAQGITLSVRDVLQCKSISQLALKASVTRNATLDSRETSYEPFALAPIQQWFFDNVAPSSTIPDREDRFNQSAIFRLQQHRSASDVAHAIETVVKKHAMLRARFHYDETAGWRQSITKELLGSYCFQTTEAKTDTEVFDIIRLSETTLNIARGPVFSTDLIQNADRQLLFLTAHHLVVDLVSWRIILRDLEELLQRQTLSITQSLSFQTWCQLQAEQAASYRHPIEVLPFDIPPADWDYWGLTPGSYVEADKISKVIEIDEQTTSLILSDCNRAMRTEPVEILLAALFHSFHSVFRDRDVPAIYNEGHGREPWDDAIDLSDTVGWFTTITPLHAPVDHDSVGHSSVINTLRRTKDRRRQIPGRGLPYFLSRFHTAEGRAAFADHNAMEVLFNYHGQFQQLEKEDAILKVAVLDQLTEQERVAQIGANIKQAAVFNIGVSTFAGKMNIRFGYSRHIRNEALVLQWLAAYQTLLGELTYTLADMEPFYTTSDFPLATLTERDLESLQKEQLLRAQLNFADVEDVYPCSPIQQGILISQIKSPATYLIRQTCHFQARDASSSLDAARLAATWQQIIDRHAMLRTFFVDSLPDQELFHQVVLKSWKSEVRVIEVTDKDEVDKRLGKHHSREAFPLSQPPHRFTILRTLQGQLYGHFEVSHALIDASSINILLEDLLLAYDYRLPASKGPCYSSYITYLLENPAEEDLRYWTSLLTATEPCHLPKTNAHTHSSNEGSSPSKSITAQITDLKALHWFRDNHGITLANIFQLSWAIVLANYTSLDEVCFGYLTNGRDVPIPGASEMVGPMINMMVCAVSVKKDMTVLEAVKLVQERFFEGLDHQRTPLAAIQHSLHLSGQALFNTALSYKRQINAVNEESSTMTMQRILAEDPSEYDVSVNVLGGDKDILVSLKYNHDYCSLAMAERLLATLLQTITALSTCSTSTCLVDLQSICAKDTALIRQWNSRALESERMCVHARVQEAAQECPQAPAVCAWDGNMTYDELDRAATRLSHHLVSLGVRPEVMVGLCMDKSKWAIVSMLAILKAGGVVVPLGVEHPVARIKGIVHDIAATVMLVDMQQAKRVGGLVQYPITVDDALLSRLPIRTDMACETVTPDNAAWVIYTSGSTGKPKGVVLEHVAICTVLKAHTEMANMGRSTRRLQFAAFTFDVAIGDIFASLHCGGCVCIPSEIDRLNDLGHAMELMQVNFAWLTASVAKLVDPKDVPALKQLLMGGEAVTPAVIDQWLGHVILLNTYGPAECTITACHSRQIIDKKQASLIGYPLASHFWITTEFDYNYLCPVGVTGELLIEGPVLARGYLNDTAKTEAAFVTDPAFASELGLGKGRRMYRTGDLVRQNEDGSLTFMGRRDTQIKIRGQRVEIGEIESSIARLLAGVRAASVDLISHGSDSVQAALMAVVEFAPESEHYSQETLASGLLAPTDKLQEAFTQLRESLLEVLPSYMVPSIYVPVVKLQLNVSGKMDRKAVRRLLESVDKDELAAYMSKETVKLKPSTDIERQLQALWAAVLAKPIDSVGVNDHFFQSGGDSVTAMKMVAAGRNAQISLTVADVFGNPRLSDLARVLDTRSDEKDVCEVDALPFSLWIGEMAHNAKERQRQLADIAAQCGVLAEQIEDIYPCTPLQEGLIAVTTQQPGTYVTQRLFRMSETVVIAQFKAIWEKVVAALPILRTRIVPAIQSASLQVVVQEPVHWFSSSCLHDCLEHDRSMPIQYGGHLCRFTIIEEPEPATRRPIRYFLWTMHHSIYDGWTIFKIEDMLIRLSQDKMVPTPVPISRFVKHLSRHGIEDHRSFWQQQLDGVSKARFPSLPDALYQPQARQTARHHITMQKQPGHVTTAIVLRGAWALLVAIQKGTDEAVFNVALSGRNAPIQGITDLVCPTVTTVPVRVPIQRSQTVHDFLADIQQQATNMIPFEHTGLQNIRRLVPQLGNDFDPGHLFTVQTILEQAGESSSIASIGLERQPVGGEGFHSYAFNIRCTTDKDHQTIEVEVQFDETVIDPTRVKNLLQQFEHIYYQLSTVGRNDPRRGDDDQLVGELSLISAQDTARILDWNKDMPASVQACVHSLVLENTTNHPKAPAVCAWDGDMTYGELDGAATRLSHHLVSLGVGPEVMVGLCMDKSKWAIISMLAILKAGGAVVPLGVQHPVARIEGIIKDTEATVMLVDAQQAERVGGLVQHPLTVDHSLLASLPVQIGVVACETVMPENSAWVIYTSGSTGKPKGVVLEHAAICTLLKAHIAIANMGQSTRRLQFAAFTFDVSIGDVFGSLLCGGCICVPSENDRANNLGHAMEAMKVNFASLTASVVGLINPADVPSLQCLLLGGEAVTPAAVEQWLGHNVVQRNAYGPAECTITACHSHQITDKKQASLIGHPLASHVWVTTEFDYNYLCPVGVTGELLIEGPVLARGYLNDMAKTEAAFVTDPAFVKELGLGKGRRMYRTGDLVRQNDDGSLTYVGRRDTQIKIRGQRVETGEIESSIARLFVDVRAAAVNMILSHSGQAALIAAVEFTAQSQHYSQETLASGLLAPTLALEEAFTQLRDSLLEILPSYMVPNIYVPIAKLPLNASGKMDRKAIHQLLESVDKEQLAAYMSTETKKVDPSTHTERQLQALWAAVLAKPIDLVGANDHFFQSGGDSVTAMKLVAAGRNAQISLTVADIFGNPRLSDLARVLDNRGSDGTENESSEDALPFSLWEEGMELNVVDRQRQLANVAAQCGVLPEQIEDIYPCTPLQEGLMAVTTQQPGTYVAQRLFRMSETMVITHFQAMWEKLVASLPILRTRIVPAMHSASLQVVVQEPVRWFSSSSLQEYLEEDRSMPIQYGGHLCRFAIIEELEPATGQLARYFLWTIHHSIYDGWTTFKIEDMLVRLSKDEMVPRPVPVSRFVRHLSQHDSEDHRSFWQQQLDAVSITKFPSLPDPSYQPRAKQMAQHHIAMQKQPGHITTAIVLRGAWALLVATYTGMNEAVFNVALSGRNAPILGVMDLIAPTVTTVPVRVPIQRSQTVHDFLADIQQQATDMIPFEHTGLQNIRRLVPQLGSDFDPGHLFTVQTIIEKAGQSSSIESIGLKRQPVGGEGFHSYAFNISCTTDRENQAIQVEVQFDEAVISMTQVEALLHQFEHIYHQLSTGGQDEIGPDRISRENDNQIIGGLSLISTQDTARILDWNKDMPVGVQACVHNLVLESTARYPEAPAVCAWDGDMTYDELDRAATCLSHHLVSLGVGPEVMVGLCLDKSKWAIVSMLAILKAGGAVVPLGVQHPVARIQGIINDTAATVMLVDAQQAERVGHLVQHPVRVDDSLLSSLPIRTGVACETVLPHNAAWVIFTSGSTGTPKGVVLEHEALCTSLRAHGSAFGMDHNTRSLQFAAYTFDASIQDTMTTLVGAGCICIPSEHQRMNNLASAIDAMKVNCTTLTSTVAGLLDPSQVPTLKTLVFGGEAVSPAVVKSWLGHTTMLNSYGATECSINSSCSVELMHQSKSSNIGYAIGGRFWVVDQADYRRLVPVGAPGELLIEGPQLARGYLHDTVKTEAAFVTDPAFASELGLGKGRRMYRTGDLVRQNEDGSLTYFGRRDTQIKIRGQRVETGEIESSITRLLADVRAAAVDLISRAGDSRQAALMAVVEFASESKHYNQETLTSGLLAPTDLLQEAFRQLRESLLEVLPSYMVPSIYVPIAKLPLNASGKMDRKAVHSMLESLSPSDYSAYVSVKSKQDFPLSAPMARLRRLWAQVLTLDEAEICPDDNIFRLGGDSITAIRLVHAASAHGMQISVADVFQHPKLTDMAALISANEEQDCSTFTQYQNFSLIEDSTPELCIEAISSVLGLPSNVIVDALPATDFQALCVAGYMSKSNADRHYFMLDGAGHQSISELKQSCLKLVHELEILRTRFIFYQGKMLQVFLEGHDPEVLVYEGENTIDELTDKYVADQANRSKSLTQPMVSIAIMAQKDTLNHRILFRLSHALYDGFCFPTIWNLLASIHNGQTIDSHPKYAWYQADLASRVTTETYQYWKTLLCNSSMPQISPLLHPTRQSLHPMQALPRKQVTINGPLPAGITPAMVVKAAWASVLACHVMKDDVIFGDTTSSRSSAHPMVSKAIGCCIIETPVRISFKRNWRISDLLHHIHGQQLESSRHDSLGFRQIVHQCTDWATSTRFTSRVNHHPLRPAQAQLGDTQYKVSVRGPSSVQDTVDVQITSFQNEGAIDIGFSYAAGNVTVMDAEKMFDALCSAITLFTTSPDAPLPEIPTSQTTNHQQLTPPPSWKPHLSTDLAQEGSERLRDITILVDQAWQAVLAERRGKDSGLTNLCEFGDCGGDFVDAAHLAFLLERQGLDIVIDDVLKFPTRESLAWICYQRERDQSGDADV